MNLKLHQRKQHSTSGASPGFGERAIALVITLLMLSVITFLAVAFLAMTERDKSAVTTTLDLDTAKTMSDAALARAQGQMIAQMMAQGDFLAYDYMASHNYISTNAFIPGLPAIPNPTNVNYDSFFTNPSAYSAVDWAQNIGNLFYDPRPPVFITTNANATHPSNDFRFWVDINRNGKFETNGPINTLDQTGTVTGTSLVNGEPEWIGVLKYPEQPHSPINPFLGRYAYLVLPIGKTLDWNYIYNYAKFPRGIGEPGMFDDAYVRDEGVGSWELNLAAFLNELSPALYLTNPTYSGAQYNYNYAAPLSVSGGGKATTGGPFYDATRFLAFRYGYSNNGPQTLQYLLFTNLQNASESVVDYYGAYPSSATPFDFNFYSSSFANLANLPWAGGNNSNQFYDIQDMFDPTKTGVDFPSNLANTVSLIDTTNRYAFQTMLGSIGSGSSPEYGVFVYTNLAAESGQILPTNLPPPSMLRTKVNINFDNSSQIAVGPYNTYGGYNPMPTNMVPWSNNIIGFFTNAADLLLRSQVFVFTNYLTNAVGQYIIPTGTSSNYLLETFGITNIPIYSVTNPGITYNEQVHRMLQVAANIYAAAYPNPNNFPPVFRPQFSVTFNNGLVSNIYITNFVLMATNSYNQIVNPSGFASGFKDFTNTTILPNDNLWGVPWVVGAVKGLPEFNQYSYQYRVFYQRALHFVRYTLGTGWDTNRPPQYTNQYYEMSVSNICGMDAWNPYASNYVAANGALWVVASNYITVTITNNYKFGTNINITNVTITNVTFPNMPNGVWPGTSIANSFTTFLTNNSIALPYSYFSEYIQNFVNLPYINTNISNTNSSYSAGDSVQSTKTTGYPTHFWTVSVTNHLLYTLYDGAPALANARLLDFVNIGPFGSSFPVTHYLQNNSTDPFSFAQVKSAPTSSTNSWWWISPANDQGTGGIPQGDLNQISSTESGASVNIKFALSLEGTNGDYPGTVGTFATPPENPANTNTPPNSDIGPYANFVISNSLMACDPLVHYTLGDLTWPGAPIGYPSNVWSGDNVFILSPWISSLGSQTTRYQTGIGNANLTVAGVQNTNIVMGDPGMFSSDNWQFPTNIFPGVGWLGRVHRGTPWETIYLKPDATNSPVSFQNWYSTWVNSPFTYPTNDWSLIDLFTAAPNDNAARGLLSVNQTNAAAWAAVFAGVIAMTNYTDGIAIPPSIDPSNVYDYSVYSLVDYTNGNFLGINQARQFQPNGLYHKIGDIAQASTLTINSPFIAGLGTNITDEMVERIPQQTLSLMKLGMPQFVIYAWGQSLKPQSLYSGSSASLDNICTNYEITGEYMTRTVCHVLSDPGAAQPKIIVDSFNIEPGN